MLENFLNIVIFFTVLTVILSITCITARLAEKHAWLRWVFFIKGLFLSLLIGGAGALTLLATMIAETQPDELPEEAKLLFAGNLPAFYLAGASFLWVALHTLLITLPWSRRFLMRLILPKANPESILHCVAAVLYLPTALYLLQILLFTSLEDLMVSLQAVPMVGSVAVLFITQCVVTAVATGMGWKRTIQETFTRLGLKALTRQDLLLSFGLAVGLLGVILLLNIGILAPFFPEVMIRMQSLSSIMHMEGPLWLIVLNYLGIAFCASVGEELFFRGLLQPVFGIVLTTILFTLIHTYYGPTVLLVQIFGVGLFFAVLRQKKSLSVAMLTHGLYDFLALCVSHLLERGQ